MFEDMAHPGATAKALEKSAALAHAAAMLDHGGEPAHEPFVETGNHLGRSILEFFEIDPSFENGEIGPNVRAAKFHDLANLHGRLRASASLIFGRRWQRWT